MPAEKGDIQNRQDIDLLVRAFYNRLLHDDRMAYLFENVKGDHLEEHFDILCDFWESVLFLTGQYKRNTMLKHLSLHDQHGLTAKHFNLWLDYFNETVDSLFQGNKSKLAKERAHSIAVIMQMKIKEMDALDKT
ncbi:MAG: group III truncated hemoglobin [Saprospiraceae bacterium]|nr:group III truncated hemoglobin [Saprospiraceae bacterium]